MTSDTAAPPRRQRAAFCKQKHVDTSQQAFRNTTLALFLSKLIKTDTSCKRNIIDTYLLYINRDICYITVPKRQTNRCQIDMLIPGVDQLFMHVNIAI